MKLAFSTLGCPSWAWQDVLSTAADLGYQGIEVRGLLHEMYAPRMAGFSPAQWEKTQADLRRAGMEVPCFSSSAMLHNAQLIDAAHKEAEDYILLAERTGTPFVRVLGDTAAVPDGQVDDALVVSALSKLGAMAASRNVTLLVETNGCFANTARLKKVLDAVGLASVQALWDIQHPYRFFGESPEQTVDTLGSAIRFVHVKDSAMVDGVLMYRMLGAGDLPIEECLRALNAIGYEGYLSLEWVKRWQTDIEEPGIAFAHAVKKLKGMI